MWAGLNQAIRDVPIPRDTTVADVATWEKGVIAKEGEVSQTGPTMLQAKPRQEQDISEETPEVDMKLLQMQMAKKRANLQV